MTDKFYVLVQSKANTEDVWLLSLEAESKEKCQRAISWQHRGGQSHDSNWYIVWYNPDRRDFVSIENHRAYVPYRGIYTHDAWEGFIEKIGGITCHTPVMDRWNKKGDVVVWKKDDGMYAWNLLNEHGNKVDATRSYNRLNDCIYSLEKEIGEKR